MPFIEWVLLYRDYSHDVPVYPWNDNQGWNSFLGWQFSPNSQLTHILDDFPNSWSGETHCWELSPIFHSQQSIHCNLKAEEGKLKELHRQDLTTVPWGWTCHLSPIQASNVGHVGCFLLLEKGPVHAASTVPSKPASRTAGWHRMTLGLYTSWF